jgi:hypothetical protein
MKRCRHKRSQLRQLVARAAARQLSQLPPGDRADLLEGIAPLLADAGERELARHTVGLIHQSEEHQVKLFQKLTGGGE